MNRKADMTAALEHRQPLGAVPLWELHFHCWSNESGKHFVSGMEFAQLPDSRKELALARDAEIIFEVSERLGFAAVTLPDPPWNCIYTLPHQYRLSLARMIRRLKPDFMLVAGCSGVLAMPDSSDYVEFCYRLMDEPEEIDRQCAKKFEAGIESMKQLADAGVEAVYTASDMADNRGPFFNPQQMERFILPYLNRWVAEVKKAGLKAILHTDGDVTSLLPDIVASGVEALQAIDPVAGMDMKKVKDRVGNRLALCGNVDCGLLISGRPEDIYRQTAKLLDECKSGGGLVLGASNAVVVETPLENYHALVEAWRDHGSYQTILSGGIQ